jgi:hypothetical protein
MRINGINAPISVVIILVFICTSIGGFLFEIPSDIYRSLGTCLIIIGVFNILLHKRFGRQIFEWSHDIDFWKKVGKDGTQFLYLGIGVIFFVAGAVLLIGSLFV